MTNVTEQPTGTPPPSLRMKRLVRHWALVFLIALGFLLMVLFVPEKDKVVPAQGISLLPGYGPAVEGGSRWR